MSSKALNTIRNGLPSYASINYRPDLGGVEVAIIHEQSLLGTWAFIANVDEAHRLTDAVRINRHFTNDRGGQYRFPQFSR